MHTANYQKDLRSLSEKRDVKQNNVFIFQQPVHTKKERYLECCTFNFYIFNTNVVNLYLFIESFDIIYYASPVNIYYVTIYDFMYSYAL
jgi:hypothetical protein